MNLVPVQARQGDVYLLPVDELPAGCVLEDHGSEQCLVLARGEATGHAHIIHRFVGVNQETQAMLARSIGHPLAQLWVASDEERYLEVRQSVMLRHEEHSPIAISPGVYHLPVQVEVNPEEAFLMMVAD